MKKILKLIKNIIAIFVIVVATVIFLIYLTPSEDKPFNCKNSVKKGSIESYSDIYMELNDIYNYYDPSYVGLVDGLFYLYIKKPFSLEDYREKLLHTATDLLKCSLAKEYGFGVNIGTAEAPLVNEMVPNIYHSDDFFMHKVYFVATNIAYKIKTSIDIKYSLIDNYSQTQDFIEISSYSRVLDDYKHLIKKIENKYNINSSIKTLYREKIFKPSILTITKSQLKSLDKESIRIISQLVKNGKLEIIIPPANSK